MVRTALLLVRDLLHFVALVCSSHRSLAAENLFLRKQLAFYLERKVKPRRVDDATRITLVVLARCLDWRHVLTIVQPDTLVRWHRQGFRLFWRWTSRCRGRPRIPMHLQELIATMACANRTWGEERIAAELLVKLGIVVSPRTVRRYMRRPVPLRPRSSSQQWRTFLRNHAGEILACDFFVTVTATFRLVYVFLVLDIGTRRILHWNVTEQPTANGLCNMRFSFSNLTTTVSSRPLLVPRKGRILRLHRFPEHCRTPPGTLPDLSNSPHQSFSCSDTFARRVPISVL